MSLDKRQTAAQMLREFAELDALAELVSDRKAQVRERLHRVALRLNEETGTAPSLKAKGVGTAYITEPGMHPVVTDDEQWADYAERIAPDRVERRTAVNTQRLLMVMDSDPSLKGKLTKAGVIQTERIVDGSLAHELADRCPRSDSGALVDPDTGELLPVVMRPNSKPTFVVKPDKKLVRQLCGEIRTERGWMLEAQT